MTLGKVRETAEDILSNSAGGIALIYALGSEVGETG